MPQWKESFSFLVCDCGWQEVTKYCTSSLNINRVKFLVVQIQFCLSTLLMNEDDRRTILDFQEIRVYLNASSLCGKFGLER